jgi:hypothetical protein
MFPSIVKDPSRFFSVVGPAYITERHCEIAYHDVENRRRRREGLSVLAGLPCLGRNDYLSGISDRAE